MLKRWTALLLALALLCACLPAFAYNTTAELEAAAAAGDAQAMGVLGAYYYYGIGYDDYSLPQDDAMAFYWFSRGAMGGDPYSMEWLGYMYRDGIGTQASDAMALVWWEMGAAEDAYCAANAGFMYKLGKGTAQNLEKAESYFWQALENNYDPYDAEFDMKWDCSDASDFNALVLDAYSGDENAMCTLGYVYYMPYYYDGYEDYSRDDLALYWWEKAAEAGLMIAMFNTAHMYYQGYGTDVNEDAARYWIHQFILAESTENPSASVDDAFWYDIEDIFVASARPTPTPPAAATPTPRSGGRIGGNVIRKSTATPTPKPAVNQPGETAGQLPGGKSSGSFSAVYEIDPGRPAETMLTFGLDVLVEAYALGDLDAAYVIAWCFANGEGGLEKDEALAFEWWLMLAEDEEDPRAWIWVAEAYYYGQGVAQDYEEAIRWYKVMAEDGDDAIMNKLGVFYFNGKIVAQDYAEALKWFLMAAEEGNLLAMGNAADIYNYGLGVPQDLSKAFVLYKESSEGGNVASMNNLGVCYINGRGTAKDAAQGAYWITQAAEAGHAQAMDNLGQLYEKGVGVSKDASLARYWYQKAAEAGNEHAKTKLGQ